MHNSANAKECPLAKGGNKINLRSKFREFGVSSRSLTVVESEWFLLLRVWPPLHLKTLDSDIVRLSLHFLRTFTSCSIMFWSVSRIRWIRFSWDLLRLHFQHMQHVAARQAGRNGSAGTDRAEGWSGVCKDARKARYSHAQFYFKIFQVVLYLFDIVWLCSKVLSLRMSHRQGWRYPASDLAKPNVCA